MRTRVPSLRSGLSSFREMLYVAYLESFYMTCHFGLRVADWQDRIFRDDFQARNLALKLTVAVKQSAIPLVLSSVLRSLPFKALRAVLVVAIILSPHIVSIGQVEAHLFRFLHSSPPSQTLCEYAFGVHVCGI
jgi:hypothetical protein